jgi:environmental stress-induced protein Ves
MIRSKSKPASRVLKHKNYRTMPWRNGRGSTLEIARDPASGEEFAWRLSLADIEDDGDFSAYPGYRRALVLIAGNRLYLRFKGHGHCFLNPTRPGTRFEGDWKTRCALPEGRCTDLSLIVRRGTGTRPASIVRAPLVLRVTSSRRLVVSNDLYTALFVLQGDVVLAESTSVRSHTLRPRDTLLLSPGLERALTIRNLRQSSPARIVLLRWRPDCPHRSISWPLAPRRY